MVKKPVSNGKQLFTVCKMSASQCVILLKYFLVMYNIIGIVG